jgi:hypothetical protein
MYKIGRNTSYYADSKLVFTDRWLDSNFDFHRLNGPAFVMYASNGSTLCQNWCIHGRLHREDGPAIIDNVKLPYYYLGDVGFTKPEYDERLKLSKKIREDGRNSAIMYLKHDCPYIRSVCKDIINNEPS